MTLGTEAHAVEDHRTDKPTLDAARAVLRWANMEATLAAAKYWQARADAAIESAERVIMVGRED